MIKKNRYILDAIYGAISLPEYVWDVLFIPELQRLRELRLYNVNSLYFTGGGNINRFEHSIGTCYLATQCLQGHLNYLSEKEKMLIVLAALFHDVYNGAFGHSVEYIEGYSPEDIFSYVVSGKDHSSFKYKYAEFEPIYFGMCREISSKLKDTLKLSDSEIDRIGQYIKGEGEFGALISGTMDLDNIDNVYRMSYHMGLLHDTKTPIKIAQSIWCKNGHLILEEKSTSLVKKWIERRRVLYEFLLFNPDEFSAKYMLTESMELSKKNGKKIYTWYDTDFQVLEKLSNSSSDVSTIISRLMKGNFYGCFGLYKTLEIKNSEKLSNPIERHKIEDKINKTFRPEAQIIIEDFSDVEKSAIKGIVGISYNSETCHLTLANRINMESLAKLSNGPLKKRKKQLEELKNIIKQKISTFKLKAPKFGIHAITDINKTNRKVNFNLPNGKTINIGKQSKNHIIGVFIKNIEFANFNTLNNTVINNAVTQNIKDEIFNILTNVLQDPNLIDLPLYSEVLNAK